MSEYGQQPPYGDVPPEQPGYPGAYPGYGAPYGLPVGPPPPNHLARAIVAIFFFWPLAIAAIVKATQVDSMWSRGDYYGAQAASDSARKYANICFFISIAWVVFVLIMFFVVVSAGAPIGVPSDPGGFAHVRGLLGV